MIRFVIWAAVSTEEQAKSDKESLREQEKRCRAAAAARGWHEALPPYVAPGESRTRYVNLRDAEDEIPALHRLLEDAKAHLFDLVVLYDYNRLRDLLDPVAKTLTSYGVQLFSVNQPIDPLPPEEFSPYASDSESMLRGMSQVISRWQINDLRRKHAYGVLGRVRKGLHPSGTKPYGYVSHNPKLPLEIVPAEAAVCTQIKDLFLGGLSIYQIQCLLNEQHVPRRGGAPWTYTAVRYLLTNPFYAGLVRLGYEKKVLDPRTGKIQMVRGDASKMVLMPGLHQPLWDAATYEHIQAELKRRLKRYKGRKTERLSGLLYCAEHDRPLQYRVRDGIHDPARAYWACRFYLGHWHVYVRDGDVLDRLGPLLRGELEKLKKKLKLPPAGDDAALLRSARTDLLNRRERLTDALEQGAIDPMVYARRTEALDGQILAVQAQLAPLEARNSSQQVDAMLRLVKAIESTPAFLRQAPPQLVNAQLRAVLEKILVDEEGNFEFRPR